MDSPGLVRQGIPQAVCHSLLHKYEVPNCHILGEYVALSARNLSHGQLHRTVCVYLVSTVMALPLLLTLLPDPISSPGQVWRCRSSPYGTLGEGERDQLMCKDLHTTLWLGYFFSTPSAPYLECRGGDETLL